MFAVLRRTKRGYKVGSVGLTERQADAKVLNEEIHVLVEYRQLEPGLMGGIGWEIEATQWYHPDGFCKLKISDVTAEVALTLYGALLWTDEKSDKGMEPKVPVKFS